MTSEECMRLAIEEAKIGMKNYDYPFGCCLIYKGTWTVAHNTCISEKNVLRHAEINAIEQMCRKHGVMQLKGATIFTTTEPCVMCMGAISWSGITRLIYGVEISHSFERGFREIVLSSREIAERFPEPLVVEAGLLEDECMALYTLWEEKRRMYQLFHQEESEEKGDCHARG